MGRMELGAITIPEMRTLHPLVLHFLFKPILHCARQFVPRDTLPVGEHAVPVADGGSVVE